MRSLHSYRCRPYYVLHVQMSNLWLDCLFFTDSNVTENAHRLWTLDHHDLRSAALRQLKHIRVFLLKVLECAKGFACIFLKMTSEKNRRTLFDSSSEQRVCTAVWFPYCFSPASRPTTRKQISLWCLTVIWCSSPDHWFQSTSLFITPSPLSFWTAKAFTDILHGFWDNFSFFFIFLSHVFPFILSLAITIARARQLSLLIDRMPLRKCDLKLKASVTLYNV